MKGGIYEMNNNIWEELEKVGINEEDRFYEWFAFYDFESLLQKVDNVETTKTKYTTCHVPISFSISSNIPGNIYNQCCGRE